jgi:hypothetical protein
MLQAQQLKELTTYESDPNKSLSKNARYYSGQFFF